MLKKDYSVNSINININKRLGLFGMLGILQDIAATHADLLGVGVETMIKNNIFWVMGQQHVKMAHWPKWQDMVTIKTWPRGIEGLRAYRDFEIFMGGKKIGESVATFMVLDGTSRRPIRPELPDLLKNGHPHALSFTPQKVELPENMELKNTIDVRNSDLDMNNHVNNTKYSQWILDTIPLEYHRKVLLREFEMNFLAETHLGDRIDIYAGDRENEECDNTCSYFKGVRHKDQKIVFAAKLSGVLNS